MFSSLNKRQKTGLVLGPLLFIAMLLLPVPEGMNAPALRVAAVALLMASWWMTEALAIPVTALLPIILFPLLGVMPTARVTLAYGDQVLFLFMGGFIIAIAMQRWNLHRRLALTVVCKVGSSPERLVLGMMLATALLSMWVSNTATAMMMTPVAIAVIESTRRAKQEHREDGMQAAGNSLKGNTAAGNSSPGAQDNFAIALMLSIAYAASIGGFSTLVGTPPNAIFVGQLDRLYDQQVGFLDWMLMAAPISACVLVLCWFLVTRVFYRMPDAQVANSAAGDYIARELAAMGPMSRAEKRVALVFLCVAVAWVARGFLDQLTPESLLWPLFGALLTAPAWDMVSDSAIAMAGAFLLFIVPAGIRRNDTHDGFLMDWDSAVKLPWDVILLMGGGFALAEAFIVTGLTEWLAGQFGVLQGMPVFVLTLLIVVFVVFIGEMTSNAATATMFIPVMGALAVSMDMPPLTLMVPTVLATSLGFMLPVATPPNAIVFGSRY
ncbi:MAG: SLC13 family permease, partial [Pseudomonadota bacterium]|nr:SLC13 family permease [Pseudomonadota bacterium]